MRQGIRRVPRRARYRLSDPVPRAAVIRRKKGLPAGRGGPWLLTTDLPGNAVALPALYGRRLAVEELFRDGKSLRHGRALRRPPGKGADRFGRLPPVLALA